MFKKLGKKACILVSTVFIMSSIGVQYSFAEQSNAIKEGINNQREYLKCQKKDMVYERILRHIKCEYFKIGSPSAVATHKISGYIKPDLDSPDTQIRSGFKVSIVGLSEYFTYTNQDGYFEIQGVPSNTEGYTIAISKDQYLLREIKNVMVKTQDLQLGSQTAPVDMWAGDITNDNLIDMQDQMKIKMVNFTLEGDLRFDPACDLNKDGKINLADTVIIAKHFEATPESYPSLF